MTRTDKFLFSLASCFLYLASFTQAQQDYTRYVDPFIGTGGHGHTYPGATMPFGMVQLSPDTRIDGSWDGCGGYHYSDSVIYGFSHTHLSGTGCSDYGDIMIMPMMGEGSFDNKIYSSKFSHADEKAGAGFYSVKLLDENIDVALTTTTRSGIHQYIFHENGKASIILDLRHRDKLLEGKIKIVDDRTVEGIRRSEAWAKNQIVYYRIVFSKPFLKKNILSGDNNDLCASFSFDVKKNENVYLKVSLSAVNEAGAKKNMEEETNGCDASTFKVSKTKAHDAWQKELSKIEVSGGTEEQTKIFYTALYHTMVQPNIYNDVDGQYRGRDFKIHKAEGFNYYTVFSLWDTFRAWHPLMTIIDRKRTLDYIKTFLAQYEQGGLLPVWELSSNETECMIGYHSVSVITDAAVKGITGFDMEEAFQAMKKSAESRNRFGLGDYIDKGCLSVEDENESVSKTLEYSYDDWCIAQMAQLLHHEEDYKRYMERSQSWKNLFDPQTGFIRPRKNGGWLEPFDPFEVNNNYTEANAWQYTFFVPQDIETMIRMSGGKEAFEKKLDELFSAESKTTGRDQADITGMIGQYAHGNEPSHHMAYLYNYVGKPEKAQYRIRQILKDFYHASPDGLIGNEDCGQMSAWYVMNAMGIYNICPGNTRYEISPSLFSSVKVNLEDGNRIDLQQSSDDRLDNTRLMALNFPFTYLRIHNFDSDLITVSPVIESDKRTFKDNLEISISSDNFSNRIFYTLDSSEPNLQSLSYQSSIKINSTTTIKAIAVNKNGKLSKVSTAHFYKNPHPDWKIEFIYPYSKQYSAGGDEAIIDGIRGDEEWTKGNWQGYQSDFECVIDLGKEQKVGKFSAGFLQDVRSWILMPKKVEFSFSTDGVNFSELTSLRNVVHDSDYTVQTNDFGASLFRPINARYVKVKAKNYGELPAWHLGAGGQAWIFVDEIMIQ